IRGAFLILWERRLPLPRLPRLPRRAGIPRRAGRSGGVARQAAFRSGRGARDRSRVKTRADSTRGSGRTQGKSERSICSNVLSEETRPERGESASWRSGRETVISNRRRAVQAPGRIAV